MTSRLRLLLLLAFAFTDAEPLFAQQRRPMPAPTLLKGPADWRFEHLPIPPGFAPDITWKGYEEARFAPGMFDTSSTNYFTYALAVSVEGTNALAAPELKDFLDKYFKGLSTGVGRRKGITPDPVQFNAEVAAAKTGAPTPARFTAKVSYFDTFNDGRKILLNVEIEVQPKPAAKKTLVVLLISPQAKDAPVWEQLRAIGRTVEMP
jgi:hypothetical protein